MELLGLNSNLNNSFESLSIKDSLVDFLIYSLMCLCISFMSVKLLKFSSSGLMLINSYASSFSSEIKDQFYSLRHSIEFVYFVFKMHPLLILIMIVLWSALCHVLYSLK